MQVSTHAARQQPHVRLCTCRGSFECRGGKKAAAGLQAPRTPPPVLLLQHAVQLLPRRCDDCHNLPEGGVGASSIMPHVLHGSMDGCEDLGSCPDGSVAAADMAMPLCGEEQEMACFQGSGGDASDPGMRSLPSLTAQLQCMGALPLTLPQDLLPMAGAAAGQLGPGTMQFGSLGGCGGLGLPWLPPPASDAAQGQDQAVALFGLQQGMQATASVVEAAEVLKQVAQLVRTHACGPRRAGCTGLRWRLPSPRSFCPAKLQPIQ